MNVENLTLNKTRNVTLTAYLQQVDGEFGFKKRPAIIVIPGGGYSICSDREADAVAFAYSKAGYQTFILRYTVENYGKWPDPLNDYEQAYETIARHAEEWGIDESRIAVVGFSAGGHLASCAATVAEHKPAAAILVYPAILKEICDLCQPGMPYTNEKVDDNTCPCFIAAARDDHTVDIKNSLMFELALAEHGIPFESHIYSFGGHGFSTGENWINTNSISARVSNWVEDSIGWLKEQLGELTRNGFTEPNIAVRKNGDNAPILSITCSLSHILKQEEHVKEVLQPMYERMKMIAEERGYPLEALLTVLGNNSIREIMEMVQMTDSDILKIEQKLHKIPNRLENRRDRSENNIIEENL